MRDLVAREKKYDDLPMPTQKIANLDDINSLQKVFWPAIHEKYTFFFSNKFMLNLVNTNCWPKILSSIFTIESEY